MATSLSSASSSRTSTATELPPSLPTNTSSTGGKNLSISFKRNTIYRFFIALVNLFIGAECFFMMAIASNPFFADGNKRQITFFCFMVGHSICLMGALFLAGAVCAQKNHVLHMNILLLTLYTAIYVIFAILMFIGNSKTSIQAAFIFATFASIGIFGICVTQRYLHALTNDEQLHDPVGAAVRNAKNVARKDKHFQAALQQHQKQQSATSPLTSSSYTTPQEIQLQVAKEIQEKQQTKKEKEKEAVIVKVSVDNSSRTNKLLPHFIV
jgi:hypothetical protein